MPVRTDEFGRRIMDVKVEDGLFEVGELIADRSSYFVAVDEGNGRRSVITVQKHGIARIRYALQAIVDAIET